MDKVVEKCLSGIRFGDIQVFENMGVIPLILTQESGTVYIAVKEAFAAGTFKVTEISAGGSVPELKVINNGDLPVLILDGEELAGAKQNRILNTTVLIKPHWEGVIPVSCTEHGRWHFTSPEFKESGHIMERKIRAKKMAAVGKSLNEERSYRGNQGEVWDDIACLSAKAKAFSPTGAMKDIFDQKRKDLNEYTNAFKLIEGQNGLLVIINGEVAGFDAVSLSSAYNFLHEKLIMSYAIDAHLRQQRENLKQPSIEMAKEYIEQVKTCREARYESVGLGYDYRYEGNRIIGSSLVYDEKVIYAGFFTIEGPNVADNRYRGYYHPRTRRL